MFPTISLWEYESLGFVWWNKFAALQKRNFSFAYRVYRKYFERNDYYKEVFWGYKMRCVVIFDTPQKIFY